MTLVEPMPATDSGPTPGLCGCGCGEETSYRNNRYSRFRPGHDARLKGRLLTAARAGDQESIELLRHYGWEKWLGPDNPGSTAARRSPGPERHLRVVPSIEDEFEDDDYGDDPDPVENDLESIDETGIVYGKLTWQLLQNILRHYHDLRCLCEDEGIEEIEVAGVTVNIHDIFQQIYKLPLRQRQAVILVCVEDMREVDVAAIMLPGSKWASPIGAYKRRGLKKLVEWYYNDLENGKKERLAAGLLKYAESQRDQADRADRVGAPSRAADHRLRADRAEKAARRMRSELPT